jgi:IclR family acetate operon transcriptional repressor
MELLAVRPRSAPELADALGVHVRTARRVLNRLESEGYVVLTNDPRRRYRPTMRVVALAGQVVERAELPATARQHVTTLREEVGGSCHLCVPSHMFALCLVHDEGTGGCAYSPHLRELVPCHCTAAGKALLAWREDWREAVLEQPLASFTERTNVGPESLRRELARTVARGYAIEDREYEIGTRALAVPVFGETGEAVAALAGTGRGRHARAHNRRSVVEHEPARQEHYDSAIEDPFVERTRSLSTGGQRLPALLLEGNDLSLGRRILCSSLRRVRARSPAASSDTGAASRARALPSRSRRPAPRSS